MCVGLSAKVVRVDKGTALIDAVIGGTVAAGAAVAASGTSA